MTDTLAPFDFNGFSVRVYVDRHGDPWFVAADVAHVLGFASAKDAIRGLSDQHKGRRIVPTHGGDQEVSTVDEPGLYELVLKSRKPEANRFREWVVGTILPSIRKTGFYGVANETPEMKLLAGVRWLQAKCEDQAKRLEIAEPKAEAFDAYVDLPGSMSLREAAQHLGQNQGDFIAALIAGGYLYRQRTRDPKRQVLRPYARWVDAGVFAVRFVAGIEYPQTLITRAGIGKMAQIYAPPRQTALQLSPR